MPMSFSARKLYYALPPAVRFMARRLYYLPIDTWENLTGQRDDLTPPRGMIYTGSGAFRKQGKELVERFVELAGLQPHHAVLDIGSGIGRVAIPLTEYLSEEGRYEGFDVVEKGVQWCQTHITRQFPNFQFQYIPLNNDLYRSDGQDATQFSFPYPDDQFDLIVVNSVFTHMLPEEVDNYLGEIRRVLTPTGKCYASFFILNEAVKTRTAQQDFRFAYDYGTYALIDEKVKAANVAFEESYLLDELLPKNGLQAEQSHPGYWSGLPKEKHLDFQDFLILSQA
jgi:ubiquinone/menaquinone biosynthesis C-methylase UbiE